MEGCTPCRMPLPTSARRKAAIARRDRKSTRLNSSHGYISYAVFCLKKKKTIHSRIPAARQLQPGARHTFVPSTDLSRVSCMQYSLSTERTHSLAQVPLQLSGTDTM